MASPTIRLAKTDDLYAIEQCARAAYQKYVDRIGRAPAPMVADFASAIAAQQVYVAELAIPAAVTPNPDKTSPPFNIAGYAVCYPRGHTMHLENVAVFPQLIGQGYGRKLIDFVEQQALLQKCEGIELYTNARMTENLQLYPALGYQQTGRRTEAGFDRVYFFKPTG